MPDLSKRKGKMDLNAPPKPPQISYWFFGKIALFPIIMLFLAAGAIALFIFRRHLSDETPDPGLSGYLTSEDLSYGLAGLVLSIICAIMLIFFLFWHVIRISFTFDAQEGKFTVSKRGIFRKSTLDFDMSDMSFHYFRTHFAENKRWLQFVVREGDIYFQLYSWRGKGSQTDTFLNLFQRLQHQLEKAQEQMLMPIHPSSKYPTEIVSKEEFTLIGPFTARLKGFAARQRNSSSLSGAITGPKSSFDNQHDQISSTRSIPHLPYNSSDSNVFQSNSSYRISKSRSMRPKSNYAPSSLENRGWSNFDANSSASDNLGVGISSICEEQIEMVDYDSLLRHFKYEKRLGGPIMPGERRSAQSNLASVVRKA